MYLHFCVCGMNTNRQCNILRWKSITQVIKSNQTTKRFYILIGEYTDSYGDLSKEHQDCFNTYHSEYYGSYENPLHIKQNFSYVHDSIWAFIYLININFLLYREAVKQYMVK